MLNSTQREHNPTGIFSRSAYYLVKRQVTDHHKDKIKKIRIRTATKRRNCIQTSNNRMLIVHN